MLRQQALVALARGALLIAPHPSPHPPWSPQIEELSLSGNQRRSDMLRRRLRFKAGESLTNTSWVDASSGGGGSARSTSRSSGGASAAEAAELAGAEIIDCRSECACLPPLALGGHSMWRMHQKVAAGSAG